MRAVKLVLGLFINPTGYHIPISPRGHMGYYSIYSIKWQFIASSPSFVHKYLQIQTTKDGLGGLGFYWPEHFNSDRIRKNV